MNKKRFIASMLLAVLVVGLLPAATFAAGGSVYTVRPGESLYLISKNFGVGTDLIKSANGMRSNTIFPGQQLWVPQNYSAGAGSYTVQWGDSLFEIARKYGVSIAALKGANGLAGNTIKPGQVLTIPGVDGQAGSPAVSGQSLSEADIDLMARAVYAEARGEVYEGQVAVAAVILNRLNNPVFPRSISGIIYQPYAFSSVNDGQINMTPDDQAYKAVRDAINGWDPTGGAMYFWNPDTSSSTWIHSRTVIKQIGSHIFGV